MWIYDGRGNSAQIEFVNVTPPGVYCKPPEKVRRVVRVRRDTGNCGYIGWKYPEAATNAPEWVKRVTEWAKTAPVSCGCPC